MLKNITRLQQQQQEQQQLQVHQDAAVATAATIVAQQALQKQPRKSSSCEDVDNNILPGLSIFDSTFFAEY